jgi:hypothetical protein
MKVAFRSTKVALLYAGFSLLSRSERRLSCCKRCPVPFLYQCTFRGEAERYESRISVHEGCAFVRRVFATFAERKATILLQKVSGTFFVPLHLSRRG